VVARFRIRFLERGIMNTGMIEVVSAECPNCKVSKGRYAGEVRQFLGDLNINFCWCPAGRGLIGQSPGPYSLGPLEPKKAEIFGNGFWMGETVVTQGLWKRIKGTTPWAGEDQVCEGDQYPATYISWHDAISFCEKLNRREQAAGRLPFGWCYRLPTTFEWEYACRAGTDSSHYFHDEVEDLDAYMWFDENTIMEGESYAHEVGQKLPNPWGLFDMHGNVDEWCETIYRDDSSRKCEEAGCEHVEYIYRGGSWSDPPDCCQSESYAGEHSYFRGAEIGLRLVLITDPFGLARF